MATIVVTGKTFIGLTGINLHGIWTGSQSVYESNTADIIQSNNGALSFEGSGFTSFDSQGYALAGTMTDVGIFSAGAAIRISDLSISAADMTTAIRTNDSDSFINLLFGGDDTFTCSKTGSGLNGFAGADTMNGGAAHDVLLGGDGDDTILGNAGADYIEGDKGADTLTGGKGNDTFVFLRTADSHTGGIDTITDLNSHDTIDLSGIDANTGVDMDQEFTLVGAFTNVAGQLTVAYDAVNHRTVISGDVNGDGHADLIIYATGNHGGFTHFDF